MRYGMRRKADRRRDQIRRRDRKGQTGPGAAGKRQIVRREVVEHPGGVGILPLDDNGVCYMVRQFRYPFSRQLLEIPAGKLEYGEDPLACAVRELGEETGFTADELIPLGKCLTSPGFSSEVLHLYLARGLHAGRAHLDEDEFLNVEKHPLAELAAIADRN